MNKKLLLGLGGISLLFPLFAFVSCASANPIENNYIITSKKNPIFSVKDLNAMHPTNSDASRHFEAANKLFTGLNKTNFSNMELTLSSIIPQSFELTANSGFTINDRKKLTSYPVTINTDIKKIEKPIEISKSDILTENLHSKSTIEKLFTLPSGDTWKELLDNDYINITLNTINNDLYTITIKGVQPFWTINNLQSITSNQFSTTNTSSAKL